MAQTPHRHAHEPALVGGGAGSFGPGGLSRVTEGLWPGVCVWTGKGWNPGVAERPGGLSSSGDSWKSFLPLTLAGSSGDYMTFIFIDDSFHHLIAASAQHQII